MIVRKKGGAALAATLWLITTAAPANMGGTSSSFGILPHDVATAQALSMFNGQASAVYYNPAGLASEPGGQLTGGIFYAEHYLKASSRGGDAPMDRSGSRLDRDPTEQLLIGMKTDISELTTFRHPMYLGFLAGTEEFAGELLSFNAKTSEEGQFLQYGRQPLFLAIGVGTQLWRGINVGAALRITLQNEATLYTTTNLQGDTRNERLTVNATPVFRPIFGLTMNAGETFCTVQDCWSDNLEFALGYRTSTLSKVNAEAEAEITGTITDPGLELSISAISHYQPETTSLGVQYAFAGRTRVGLSVEYQDWKRLESRLSRDTIADQANVEFSNITVPRLGVAHDVTDHFTVKSGIALEESPLADGRNPDVNFLDNDKLILGIGFSALAPNIPFMAHPVRIDFGYQFHHLRKRKFELSSSDPADPDPFETVEARGDVHAFSGSLTMQF